MNNRWRCTEEEWLKLHEKVLAYDGDTYFALTREEKYIYYNLRNVPEKYQIDKSKYKRVK